MSAARTCYFCLTSSDLLHNDIVEGIRQVFADLTDFKSIR